MPLGVDIGGTFTDLVLLKDGALAVLKVPSTPENPALGLLDGAAELGDRALGEVVVHGSTVATNALLERKGARAALITTKGFRDILVIGRQNRPRLYDLAPQRPAPLIEDDLRLEVDERLDASGQVLQPLCLDEVESLLQGLKDKGIESLALCLLFSFRNPAHEKAIQKRAEEMGFQVAASYEVLPEYREYERTSTMAVSAYVSPIMDRYLSTLEEHMTGKFAGLRIMQSNGGIISAATARKEAVRTVLSGPAAGVVGAAYIARMAGLTDIISFDMGGTSTDVSLCNSRLQETTEGVVGGCPIRLPMIAVHTVGAGGGSIAWLDAGGVLRVGPESAGADPGPVCYGRGDDLTVTDAHLILGRLSSRHALGGSIVPDEERTQQRMAELGRRMGRDAVEAARSIVRVANANMERAIRVVSVRKGHDPRRFTLVAFGGAGPLHACELAASLRIPRVLVPRYPGVLSALGLLAADVVKDYSQTVMWQVPPDASQFWMGSELTREFRQLMERGYADMRAEGLEAGVTSAHLTLDMRYLGQSYEVTVPLDGVAPPYASGALPRFHTLHHEAFGHSHPQNPVEIVTLRLKMIGLTQKPTFMPEPLDGPDASHAVVEERDVWFEQPEETRIYQRERLRPGNYVPGPAIVTQMDATTAVPPGWLGRVDGYGNIILERA